MQTMYAATNPYLQNLVQGSRANADFLHELANSPRDEQPAPVRSVPHQRVAMSSFDTTNILLGVAGVALLGGAAWLLFKK